MSVTPLHAVGEREQNWRQIDKLAASHTLHGSESLCKLLRYLAEHALHQPGVPVKEYQIATEVFGRPPGFDPQVDSTIRVQAGRLRLKLAEYYATEGVEDSIGVELPKGSYLLTFHTRVPASEAKNGEPPPEPSGQGETALQRRMRLWMIASIVLAILLLAAGMFILGLLSAQKSSRNRVLDSEEAAIPAYRTFWRAFVTGPEQPWVVFSNGAFVGRPETGMRYFNPARDSREQHILDHYTGVGEVLAIHELDRTFGLLHQQIRVKRGSLLSLDDAKNNNLIFVGSPAENLSLRDLPGTQEFLFQRVESGPRKGDLGVVNVHPQADEPKVFLASPSDATLTEDYSVLALLRGLNPGRSVMILAGTTTIGTQAAVEYVCRQTSLEELLLRLSVSDNGEVQPFEAVLRVTVKRGVPVQTELVALRKALP
jgi:hypothetical protein